MFDLDTYTKDFGIPFEKWKQDLNELIEKEGDIETKGWWYECSHCLTKNSMNAVIGVPTLKPILDKLWYKYEEEKNAGNKSSN